MCMYNRFMQPKAPKTRTSKTDLAAVRRALAELQRAVGEIYGQQAPSVWVYGSYARGEASDHSDVDILLLYGKSAIQPAKEISRLKAILSALNLRYQVLISILPAPVQQYLTSNSVFWNNLRREAIPIEQL